MIMAAGTGGHIFPALCIAEELARAGAEIHWLGTGGDLESELLRREGYPVHTIDASGLRGVGPRRLLAAPAMLQRSLAQSLGILRRVRPDCLLGMGGYVCGPGALAGRWLRIPLLIHEQNAVPGLTNRLLGRWADRVLEAFPGTFPAGDRVQFCGNPIRDEIIEVGRKRSYAPRRGTLRLLVLGGSRGAAALNALVPELIATWPPDLPLETLHQCGGAGIETTAERYREFGLDPTAAASADPDSGGNGEGSHRLVGFIDDIAAAYAWADLVLCRSGAGAVAEIAACGLPAIFVPYPHHRDRQQLFNARWLAARQAAEIAEQSGLSADELRGLLLRLDGDREWLAEMSRRAKDMAVVDAAARAARACLEVADG